VESVVVGPVTRRLNSIPGEGGIARALADGGRIDACRQLDIRDHAAMLRALAGDAVVLAYRQRQLSVLVAPHHAVEVEQVLNGALAERLLPDDDAALVVLDGRGKDLGRARAVAVHEHDERAVVDRLLRAGVVEHLDVAPGLLQLNDGAAVDEETAQLRRFGEVAAAVLAQVHHEADDAFGLELANEPRDVARRAHVLGVAAAPGVEILIEARDGDDADLELLAVDVDRLDRLFRGLLF